MFVNGARAVAGLLLSITIDADAPAQADPQLKSAAVSDVHEDRIGIKPKIGPWILALENTG